MRILIIEDEPTLGNLLKDKLEAEAYAVDVEGDGEKGLYRARTTDYDAIVLDDILPTTHGSAICEALRKSGKTVPILLMSADSPIDKKVKLLDGGADDYLAKPFVYEEMSARLRALLRRPKQVAIGPLRVGDLMLDETKASAERAGKTIYLTTKEFALLRYLMKNVERVVSHAMILEHVWDDSVDVLSNMIETHMYNLRKKIERRGEKKLIKTISGRGYMLTESW
jgi:two-component system copper resistance phosphate regulon response regulator CusR